MSPNHAFQVPGEVFAPRTARVQLQQFLAPLDPPAAGDDFRALAALLTSELVTQAVTHGDGVLGVEFDFERERLRVTVADVVTSAPMPGPPADDEEQPARSRAILDALADRWGGSPSGPGGCLWFELEPHLVR